MTEVCGNDHASLSARLEALENMVEERASRNKERLDAVREFIIAAQTASERAIAKAEVATDKRFENVNEFRKALSDMVGTMLTRTEFNAQHVSLLEKFEIQNQTIAALQLGMSNLQQHAAGKTEGLGLVGQLTLGVVAFMSMGAAVLAAVTHFIR